MKHRKDWWLEFKYEQQTQIREYAEVKNRRPDEIHKRQVHQLIEMMLYTDFKKSEMSIYNFMVDTKNRKWNRAIREQSFVLKPKDKNKLITWPQDFGALNQNPEKKLQIVSNVLDRLEGKKKSVKYEMPDVDYRSIVQYVEQN